MKTFKLLLLLISTFIVNSVFSQSASVPITSKVEDQFVQAPCFVFATVAAIESKAIQQHNFVTDLSEWRLYSTCVLDGRTADAQPMIEKTLNYVGHSNKGAIHQNSHYVPTQLSELTNATDDDAPGIFELENNNCNDQDGYGYFIGTGGESAPGYDSQASFYKEQAEYLLRLKPVDNKIYEAVHFRDTTSEDAKEDSLKSIINRGNGVIAVFKPNGLQPIGREKRDTNHGVFIFGYSDTPFGTVWHYKDSWPGDAGIFRRKLQGSEVNLDLLSRVYYITADVEKLVTCTPNQGRVSIGSTTGCQTNVSLQGLSHVAKNVIWETSENLEIVSGQNLRFAAVAPTNPIYSGYETVTVHYDDGCSRESDPFWVGKPTLTTSPSGVPAIEATRGSFVSIQSTIHGASNANWWVSNSSGIQIFNSSSNGATIQCLQTGYYYVYVNATNTCGTSNTRQIPINVTAGGGGGLQMRSKNIEESNLNFNESLAIYPNPVNDQFNVDFSLEKASNVKIELINVSNGQIEVIHNKEKAVGKHNLNFSSSEMAKGLYFIRIITNNQIENRRIIKQ